MLARRVHLLPPLRQFYSIVCARPSVRPSVCVAARRPIVSPILDIPDAGHLSRPAPQTQTNRTPLARGEKIGDKYRRWRVAFARETDHCDCLEQQQQQQKVLFVFCARARSRNCREMAANNSARPKSSGRCLKQVNE